jgi:hypothetical protein
VRITAGAAVLEDIEHFNRLSANLCFMHTSDRRMADAAQGFGHDANIGAGNYVPDVTDTQINNYANYLISPETIPANDSKTVICVPFPLGFTQLHTLIPLFATAPLQFEFHLADMADASRTANPNWSISNVRMHFTTVRMTDSIVSKFADHLRSGGSLKMHMSTWSVQNQSLPANASSFDLVSQRSFNSIKSCLVNFWANRRPGEAAQQLDAPKGSFLMGPHNPSGYSYARDNVEARLQLGSFVWPTNAAKGVCELMWRLRLGNGSAMGPLVGMIPSKIWASEAFSLLWDLERYSREGHVLTGLRTTGGSLLTVQIKNFANEANYYPSEAWLALHVDAIVTLFGDSVDIAL